MNIIEFKNLKCWVSETINNKIKEAQLYLCLHILPTLEISINLVQDGENIYDFYVDILGLFYIRILKTKNKNHAGFSFIFHIFGICFEYTNIDTRHWDYETETWENEEDDEDVTFVTDENGYIRRCKNN